MSAGDFDEHGPSHGFFHALVVMGSALALGCGGISHQQAPPNDGSGGSGGGDGGHGGTVAGGSGVGGAGGSAGSGTVGSGGSGTVGSGGTAASGAGMSGMVISATGGAPAGSGIGMGGAAGELGCPPEQWVCAMTLGCSGSNLPSAVDCSCDEARPKSPKDCAAGQSFVCRGARYDDRGYPLAQPEPFECNCIDAPTECRTMCELAFGNQARCLDTGEQIPTDTTLCDCAMILLR